LIDIVSGVVISRFVAMKIHCSINGKRAELFSITGGFMVRTKTPGLLGAKLPPFWKQRSSKGDISSGGSFLFINPHRYVTRLVFTSRLKHIGRPSMSFYEIVWYVLCAVDCLLYER
jgi:hypothetical protein